MATASIKEYGVKAKDSHWGYCVCVSRGFPKRPWCGPWVWLALQSALITMFTGLPGTVGLSLAICTFIFRAFTIVFPRHDDLFLLTWVPAHPFGTHPDNLPFSSPLLLPISCPMKRILFPSLNQSVPIFTCSSQSFLCAGSSFLCQGGTSQ